MAPLPRLFLGGLLALAVLTAAPAQAQVTVVVNPPSWGPPAPATAQYYYLPEVGGYYDLRGQQYIVQRDGHWQRLARLDGYDPRNWHPVVVEYIGAEPWSRYEQDRRRFPGNLPPGQRKRLENGKGLPPGQAKKRYGQGYGDDHDRDDDRRGGRDRRDIDRDDHDHEGRDKEHGHGKGHDRD